MRRKGNLFSYALSSLAFQLAVKHNGEAGETAIFPVTPNSGGHQMDHI